MFEFLPRQVADEVNAITVARINLWAAMNAQVLDSVAQLARLNLDTSRKFVADALEAMKSSGGVQSEQAPAWAKYCYIPQDAGGFALYGQEAGNLCAAMQKEIGGFFGNSFAETMRGLPLLSPYAASADSASDPFVHMRHAGEAAGAKAPRTSAKKT
jgi:hypothetical protein